MDKLKDNITKNNNDAWSLWNMITKEGKVSSVNNRWNCTSNSTSQCRTDERSLEFWQKPKNVEPSWERNKEVFKNVHDSNLTTKTNTLDEFKVLATCNPKENTSAQKYSGSPLRSFSSYEDKNSEYSSIVTSELNDVSNKKTLVSPNQCKNTLERLQISSSCDNIIPSNHTS